MGFWSALTGEDAADASRKAAADTYQKQQAASSGIRSAGDDYLTNLLGLSKGYAPLAANYEPWMATGRQANDAVSRLISDPSSVRSLPAYQFLMDQGTRAIDRSAASNGSLFSGRTGKALETYGQGLADKTYGDQLARLLGVSQQGLSATGANVATQAQGIGTQAQGYQGQLGARASSYGQDFNSAGTIGEGDVAAANARTKGVQGLFNTGASLLGAGLSGGFGGGLFKSGGDAIGSLLAPKGGFTGFTSFGR